MSDVVKGIARLLTEDPDVFSDYQQKFRGNTILSHEDYNSIVGILKDVAQKSGLVLDHHNLKVKFNPAGISIKNIHLSVSNNQIKKDLVQRVAEITGDDNIKHTFDKNLRSNLYLAINKEFADRVREELNLEVAHHARDGSSAEGLPMATFSQPAVTAEKPEIEAGEPMGPEPEFGPEVPPEEEESMPPMGGGMGGGMGALDDLGASGEPPSPEEAPEDLEGAEGIEAGAFGVEPPGAEGEEEGEEAPPPDPEEEDEMIDFEESIQYIANMLTEDPDIFNKKASA